MLGSGKVVVTTMGTYTLIGGFSGQTGTFDSVTLPTAPVGLTWHDFDPGAGVSYFNYTGGQVQLDTATGGNNSVLSAATGSVNIGRIMLSSGITQNVAISRTSGTDTTGFSALGLLGLLFARHKMTRNSRTLDEVWTRRRERPVHPR